jgi:hypothetical protein
VNLEDEDRELEALFQETFALNREEEDALWAQFAEHTLPEHLAWKSFTIAMRHSNRGLRQAIGWTHWAAPKIAA